MWPVEYCERRRCASQGPFRVGSCTGAGDDMPTTGGELPLIASFTLPGPSTTTTVRLAGVPDTVTTGQAVTYRATVSPAADGGDVTFIDQATGVPLCTAQALHSGTATCTTTSGAFGAHTILAAYSGDAAYRSSSTTAAEDVLGPPCPTGVTHQAPGEPWAVAATVTTLGGRSCAGYWVVTRSGGVTTIGAAPWLGDLSAAHLNAPMIGIAATPSGHGYYLLGADGGIFNFGDARFYGSTGATHLNAPVVAMAVSPGDGGYWLAGADGGIFDFGDAAFHGSTGNVRLNQPIVGMSADSHTGGYWLVAADGGIFDFDAPFYGSTGGVRLNQPVVGMSPQPDGHGYRLVAADGGVFQFGDAAFYGSLPGRGVVDPKVTTMATSVDGGGYYLINSAGTVWAFGDAPYLGNA